MRLLLTRTDRLGDVMLSLPALELLRAALPQAAIDLACRREVVGAIGPYLGVRNIGWVDAGAMPVWKYDGVVFLYAPGSWLFQAWRERVPVRVGQISKPASFFWLNAGVQQHRSRAEKSEAVYNVELARVLLRRLGVEAPISVPRVEIPSDADSVRQANAVLSALALTERKSFGVLHPGNGGSALRLSGKRYVELWRNVMEKRADQWIVTVGPSPTDQGVVDELQSVFSHIRVVRGQTLPTIREIFRKAACVVAPATGPLHLAHYVGTPTVGFYAPLRSQLARRWAPWGGTGKSITVAPDLPCPGKRRCRGEQCAFFSCMDLTRWEELIWRAGVGGEPWT